MPLRSYADGAIFGDDRSSGAVAVVGLHGWGRDRGDLLPALGEASALLLDLPGFGSSAPPSEPWGAREYANLVAQVIEESGLSAPIVFGHSFGGRVAVCLAAQRPDLVSGLVLCGVPLVRATTPSKPTLAYRVVRLLHRWRLISDERMEQRRRSSGSADYRAASGTVRDVLVRVVGETYEGELAALACPVAFLWGAEDSQVPVVVAERAAEITSAPVVDLVMIAGGTHDVHRERPDEVRRLVDAVAAARRSA
jgi:pimeloyl-ACP methyl ester carboxylesterase